MYDRRITHDSPDPALAAIVDAGIDDAFDRGRSFALELLREAEYHFWVQAVGDGTPLHPERDPISGTTPHQLAFAAGYHDDYNRTGRREVITSQLAHHIGITTDPFRQGLPVREVVDDVTTTIAWITNWYFGHLLDDPFADPTADSFDRQRDRALDLLRHESLTGFWVQVGEDSGSYLVRHGPIDPDDPDSEWALTRTTRVPMDFVFGTPEALEDDTFLQVRQQFLAQHLLVAATTLGQDPDELCREATELALRMGWVFDDIEPI